MGGNGDGVSYRRTRIFMNREGEKLTATSWAANLIGGRSSEDLGEKGPFF